MGRTVHGTALFHTMETARAARAAHAYMMRGTMETLYVYYRPMRIEAFPDGSCDLEGWTLAFPERIPSNLDVDALIAWFAARTGRLPYLTTDE